MFTKCQGSGGYTSGTRGGWLMPFSGVSVCFQNQLTASVQCRFSWSSIEVVRLRSELLETWQLLVAHTTSLTETSATDTVLLTVCVCVCLQTALGNHAITGESTHWTPGWTDSSFHQSDDSWSAFPQVLSDERRDVAGQWWPTSAVEESRGRLLTNQNLVRLFFCAQPSDLLSVSVSVSSVSWKKNLPGFHHCVSVK